MAWVLGRSSLNGFIVVLLLYCYFFQLLLSANAPWPMMEGGLLHSPPLEFLRGYNELSNLLEKCVYSSEKLNRFNIAKEVMNLLEEFLYRMRI